MVSEKKITKRYSVFHIEQKEEFGKFNCFFVYFLRYSFGRIKVIRQGIVALYLKSGREELYLLHVTWTSRRDQNFYFYFKYVKVF